MSQYYSLISLYLVLRPSGDIFNSLKIGVESTIFFHIILLPDIKFLTTSRNKLSKLSFHLSEHCLSIGCPFSSIFGPQVVCLSFFLSRRTGISTASLPGLKYIL